MTDEERIARMRKRLARLDHQIENLELRLQYPSVSMARASGREFILGTLEAEMTRKLDRLYYQREKSQLELARLIRKKEPEAGKLGPEVLTRGKVVRRLAARLAKKRKRPGQHAADKSSRGAVGRTESKEHVSQPFVEKAKRLPRASRERGPDIQTSRERVALEDKFRTELASVKATIGKGCDTLANLKDEFPTFELWNFLSKTEQQELLTDEFKPRWYARTLVMRKYGLNSRETVKKDRQKLRRAKQ